MPFSQADILIVQDAQQDIRSLERFIRSLGFHPTLAAGVDAALEAIKNLRPNLILLDIDSHGLKSQSILQRIKRDVVGHGVPVVVISSHDTAEYIVKYIQLGAEDYVKKPFWPHLLETRINNILEKKQAVKMVEKFGSYTIDEKIGEGGMAVVYAARHRLLRRPTAIKVLNNDMVCRENVSMFEKEVQTTSQLTNPHTIVIFDYGRTSSGSFYYAMEYLNGISLQTLIDSGCPIPEERVIHIMKQVCCSLSEAHAKKLIHRDIKPSNIMICNR